MKLPPPFSHDGVKRVLLVDNDGRERLRLRLRLEASGLVVDEASDGLEALSRAETVRPDAVISEVLMPRLDGFGLCRAWKRSPQFGRIPFIIRTAVYLSEQDRVFALEIGADAYHRCDEPASEVLKTLAELLNGHSPVSQPEAGLREGQPERAGNPLAPEHGMLLGPNHEFDTPEARIRHLERVLGGVLSVLSGMAEHRVPGLRGHHDAVASLATDMAVRMRLDSDSIDTLRIAAQLHDIGKFMLPLAVLDKPGPLDAEEIAVLQNHAELGYALLRDVPFHGPVAEIIRQHHERPDGKGYPHRLHAGQIRREALILAVADEFVSAISSRPYRAAISADEALAALQERAGQQFDTLTVQACRDVMRRNSASAYSPRP